jgi:excisionase family DNA binding protein
MAGEEPATISERTASVDDAPAPRNPGGRLVTGPRPEGARNSVKVRLFDALLDELAERVSEKLAGMLQQSTSGAPAAPPLMNTAAAAKWLGFSESKLRKLTRKNLIAHRKMGASVMFSTEDLETYVAEHSRSPQTARVLARQARGML